MNKKFLSAILFGALMVGTTSTFVSCKDYDDEIGEINKELTDIKSQIAALQNEVSKGNWVTSLTATEGGFTVTFKDGTSYTITNGKDGAPGAEGKPGADGKGTTVEVKDGYWYLNGEKTDYLAVTEEDMAEVKVPYVNEDGYWVFFEGEEEIVSDYHVNGAAYAVFANGVWTLNMPDADGEMQAIVLPTEASAISEIELLDANYQAVRPTNPITLLYWDAASTTKWKGPRGNIAYNITTYSTDLTTTANKLYTRIAPSSVDASELEFALIDTKDNQASITLAAKKYDGVLTRAENGLYEITVVPGSYADGGDVNRLANQFKAGATTYKGMALKPATANYRSLFNVKVTPTKETAIALGNFYFDGTYVGMIGTTVSTVPEVKVGKEVTVTVAKEYNLYDMFLSVSEEDKALFGIEFSEDGRSFKATKSPDNVTDATIDLIINTLPNAGGDDNIKTTTVTVEINRTMGEGMYEKQTKQPTKVNDTFLVSADKLKESLGSDLNAWYASVQTGADVLAAIYDNEACTVQSDLGAAGGATTQTRQLRVTMNKDNNTQVSASNIATNLNYLKFWLDINKTTKPLKIGKTYYAKLSFKSTAGKELNTIVVPFELTKPELNTILVKESGVFRDGKNLAHAYMYHGDANWTTATTSDGYKASRYYIDEAFTDLMKKLGDAEMLGTSMFYVYNNAGTVFNAEGKDTGKYTSELATVGKATNTSNATRYYVQLIEDVNRDGVRDMAGYKTDLNVVFDGYYLDVEEASWNYAEVYQFRIMSPILEGEAVAANNVVEVSATGKTKIYKEDIWAKTYNNDVKYDIFAKGSTETGSSVAPTWYREDIKSIKFSTGNKNVFVMTEDVPTIPVKATATDPAVDSYIEVEGKSENTAKLNVAIGDIWGYTLKSSVDIKTTLNLGE